MSNYAMVAVELRNEFVPAYEQALKDRHFWDAIDRIYRGTDTTIYWCCSWNHYGDQLAHCIPDEAEFEDYAHVWIDEYGYANEGGIDAPHIFVDLNADTKDFTTEKPQEE